MTDRNDHPMHMAESDAEFEDFLQGKGELARILQDLPQEQPSAGLDAAILADAAAALAAQEKAVYKKTGAANDAVEPAGGGSLPAFLWRWKLPLGLAAGVVLAIPLVVLHNQFPAPYETVATNAPTAKKITEPELPQLAKADIPSPVPPAAEAPAVSSASPEPARAAMPLQAADKSGKTAKLKAGNRFDSDSKQAESATPKVEVESEPIRIAAAPAAATAPPVATPELANSLAESAPQVAAKVAGMQPPAARSSYGRNDMPSQLAKTNETDVKPQAPLANITQGKKSAADLEFAAKPEITIAENRAADKILARPAAPVAAPAATAPPPIPETTPDASVWLQKIERLLKSERNKDALEEWKKFRQAYPGYTVNKNLQSQIEALLKQQ